MVPADKILYSLRDVTSTVDSIPLIAASVMSKKIAGGAKNIVLDVKFGDGAFMKKFDDALELAKTMCSIGRQLGRNMRAVLSSMNSPLGQNVGNSLEIIEAIETLKGNGPSDLVELSLTLASNMVMLASKETDSQKTIAKLKALIANGTALGKFRNLIETQGGDAHVLGDFSLLPHSIYRFTFEAEKSGYISKMYAKEIGSLVRTLGGGRFKKDDIIDPAVGVRIFKKPGELVEKGDRLVDVYYDNPSHKELIESSLMNSILIAETQPAPEPLIREII
jgi:pyrimidine-nucleoside phosphorylase